jgi:hypothetical protein
MTARLTNLSACLAAVAMAVALVAGCSSGTSLGAPSATAARVLTQAAAKEALLVHFGPLSYCDPDYYPDARGDETDAAREHLPAMRAEVPAWAAIAARIGFDPGSTPDGATLLAAYRDWKMEHAMTLTTAPGGWAFDESFGGPRSDPTAAAGVTHVVGTVATDGTIRVTSQAPGAPRRCPICLARGVMIATPKGPIAVEALRPGDPVWTSDRLGQPVSGLVVRVGSTPVPPGHEMVRLVLADGRTVLVSPGHPLVDGRTVADLHNGDAYDGSAVSSSARVPYDSGRTFDLLPSGETGRYRANGISLGSTLSR